MVDFLLPGDRGRKNKIEKKKKKDNVESRCRCYEFNGLFNSCVSRHGFLLPSSASLVFFYFGINPCIEIAGISQINYISVAIYILPVHHENGSLFLMSAAGVERNSYYSHFHLSWGFNSPS